MSSAPSAILIHEYVTGGGWSAAPPALGAEALELLRAVLESFCAWGRYPVVTTLDPRWAGAALPADEVVMLEAEAYSTVLPALARRCGAALIIAPEDGGALERVSRLVQDAGALLLGSEPSAVAIAADKWECSRRFAASGLPAPRTLWTTPADATAAAADCGFPLVVKPVCGAGCAGVSLVTTTDELEQALGLDGVRGAESVLLQEYVAGEAVSVSLLVAEGRAVCLSLNSQTVTPGIPFVYAGGTAGIRDERRDAAFALAEQAVALVPGLRGHVGVDLVLAPGGLFLIEVNARMTTSVVGLRRVADIDLAAAVWRACSLGELPAAAGVTGAAPFLKEGCGVC